MAKVGIKDIAKEMNLSPAAVSYALSNKGRVSTETRKSVEKVARRIGYIRNDTAVCLRTGRSNLLGVIISNMSNPYFAELLSDFEDAAREKGYLTIVASSRDDIKLQDKQICSFLSQGIAGLVICPAHGTDPKCLNAVRIRKRPVVICTRELKKTKTTFVGQDDKRAGYLAASHLLDYDIGNIAYVGGYKNTATHKDRLRGIREALREKNLSLPRSMVVPGRPVSEAGKNITKKLLAKNKNVEAIIAYNDIVAVGAYIAIQAAGRKVGKDISVIGFDNVPISQALMPQLTTIALYPRKIGKTCTDKIIAMLDKPETKLVRHLIEPKLLVRGSVAQKKPWQ